MENTLDVHVQVGGDTRIGKVVLNQIAERQRQSTYRDNHQPASDLSSIMTASVQTEGTAHRGKDAQVSSAHMTTERLHLTHGLGKESPWEAFLTHLG